MSAVQEFTEVFRTEHRQVRDLLLDLVRAFQERDAERARSLLADHDGAIRDARELLALVEHNELTAEQSERGIELTRRILPHVSDCDGLTIMVETLPHDVVNEILWTRQAALDAGLDLLDWAATTRERPA